jgi:hypothetical protein
MMLDNISDLYPIAAFAPKAAVTDNTAQVSAVVDVQGCGSLSLCIVTGTLSDADATFTLLMEESDDNSTFTAVVDNDLIGTEALASFDYADDGVTFWIGYKGAKRYVRATVTPANNTGNLFLSGVWLKGHLDFAPATRN